MVGTIDILDIEITWRGLHVEEAGKVTVGMPPRPTFEEAEFQKLLNAMLGDPDGWYTPHGAAPSYRCSSWIALLMLMDFMAESTGWEYTATQLQLPVPPYADPTTVY